jgi:hypothetical protein
MHERRKAVMSNTKRVKRTDTTTLRRQANARLASERALEGYNGYDNYETWCVCLWLDNDEGLQQQAREIVREHNAVPFGAADGLKRWVTDELLPDLGASFAADLLGAAMSEVNWLEIAKAFREEE